MSDSVNSEYSYGQQGANYYQEPYGSSSTPFGQTYNTNQFPADWSLFNEKKKGTLGGLGPGGLLLATLPLILSPMLSYLFTPVIIPITATVAAGRKKRSTHPFQGRDLNMAMNSGDNKADETPEARPNYSWSPLNDRRFTEAQVCVLY